MDDSCDWSLTAVVDVGHGAGNSSCGWNAAKDRREDVGNTLSDEFLVAVVLMTDDTVGYCC